MTLTKEMNISVVKEFRMMRRDISYYSQEVSGSIICFTAYVADEPVFLLPWMLEYSDARCIPIPGAAIRSLRR
jgi:hypothetical protein